MKKAFSLALSLMLAFSCFAGLAACGESECTEHVWETAWRHNSQSHWHNCANKSCNARSDEASHDGHWVLVEDEIITPASCYARGRGIYECEICGQRKEDDILPTGLHDFSGEYYSDAEKHWQYCQTRGCLEELVGEHVSDAGKQKVAARPYVNGEREYRCAACGWLLRTEVTYATNVAVSFDVTIRKSSRFAYDTDEPFIYEEDGQLHMAIVQDWGDSLNPTYFIYEVSFSNGLSAAGKSVPAVEFEMGSLSGTGAGISLYYGSPYSTYNSAATWNSPTVVFYTGDIRAKEAGQYRWSFRYRYGDGSISAYTDDIYVDVRGYYDHVRWLTAFKASHPDYDPNNNTIHARSAY